MKKVNCYFTSLSPIFTGDDETLGTVRTFRRRTYSLPEPIKVKSTFKNSAIRSATMMNVLYPIYRNIDTDLKSNYYGYYDQFANNIRAAASMPNKKAFLNRILQLCNIDTLSEENAIIVREAIDKFDDNEFIYTIRNEHQYLMILLREYVQYNKSGIGQFGNGLFGNELLDSLFGESLKIKENTDYIKHTEQIPCIAGNSIRGIMRRQCMADFARRTGITKFRKEIYHQLFTGGNLTGSSGQENIEFREKFVKMCPMIGLFGSAIGNQMIQSEMNVFSADLRCSEVGTGSASYWELLDVDFGTRLDSSKMEKEFTIEGEMKETSQMLYQTEKIIPGAIFDSSFALTSEDPIIESAFWHALYLFKENATIGGMSSSGQGLIDINIDLPENGADKYLEYLKENKDSIQSFFYDLNEAKK